eukprot:scaffold10170_cov136-Isochrysis_galbana.AAC.4
MPHCPLDQRAVAPHSRVLRRVVHAVDKLVYSGIFMFVAERPYRRCCLMLSGQRDDLRHVTVDRGRTSPSCRVAKNRHPRTLCKGKKAQEAPPPHTLHRACMPPRLRLGEALACPSRLALSPPLLRPP